MRWGSARPVLGWMSRTRATETGGSSVGLIFAVRLTYLYFRCTVPSMDVTATVNGTLQQCVRELTTLTEAALADGDFDSVLRVTEVLKRVSALLDSWSASQPRAEVFCGSSEPEAVHTMSSADARLATKPRPKSKQPYPRFRRDGSYLVKTGWSKKSREEYEHRAPSDVVLTVADRIDEMTAKGGTVAADYVAAALSQDGVTEVPSYQLYVALAWMRVEHLLNRIGRTGYASVFPGELAARARRRWDEMGA